jgi:hypothetical protein
MATTSLAALGPSVMVTEKGAEANVEASILGWAPGEWPERLNVVDRAYTATYLKWSPYRTQGGDLMYLTYQRLLTEPRGDGFPDYVTVWND